MQIFFVPHPSVKLAPFLRKGSLKRWKRLVASVGTHSKPSPPFHRPRVRCHCSKADQWEAVRRDPGWGLLDGKDSSAYAWETLVMGHNLPEGPLTLKATGTAIEELFLGHRDGFLGLDEVGSVEGGDRDVASFFKALSFQTSSGQAKNRASTYERSVNAIKPDTRIVLGLTSEISLAEIAERSGRQRLREEELRLIELRADLMATSIFSTARRPTTESAEQTRSVRIQSNASRLIAKPTKAWRTVGFSGDLCADRGAIGKLTKWIAAFEASAKELRTDPRLAASSHLLQLPMLPYD